MKLNLNWTLNKLYWMTLHCIIAPQGQFCEQCAAGYTRRIPGGGMFTECVRCFCNNHDVVGSPCDPETGVCSCTHSSEGKQCETCQDGFHGIAEIGRTSKLRFLRDLEQKKLIIRCYGLLQRPIISGIVFSEIISTLLASVWIDHSEISKMWNTFQWNIGIHSNGMCSIGME